MRQGGRGGHIILTSSITFNMTMPHAASYAASKAFVSSLARSLRLELEADNIHVTDLRLGRAKTEFNKKRLGKPGRTSNRYVGSMSAGKVAFAIVEAAKRQPKIAVLRPLDRLIILANRLVPGIIGRLVIKQYK
jgi:short-subunit dehydrogenase